MNRRDFIKAIGATAGAAALSGCEQTPPAKLVSKVTADNGPLPGEAALVRATCTECPAGCGVVAKVRNGHPIKLEGDPQHPVNRGGLCIRGQASLSRLYHPERLAAPMLKDAKGEFRAISWDEALAIVNGALTKPGRHVFLSSRTTGDLSKMVDGFCAKHGVERLPEYEVYSYAAIRKANKIVFGTARIPYYDVKNADFLLTIGADVLETFANPVQFTADLAGKEIHWTHVESHLSLTGINADKRLTLRPGSEAWLLAYLTGTVEKVAKTEQQTGLKETVLVELREKLQRAAHPLVIVGHQSSLLAAVLCAWLQAKHNAPLDWERGLDYSRVGTTADLDKLRDASFGVIFIHNTDPVGTRPTFADAMKKSTFRVGCADLWNPTMRACDLVLPLSHELENAQALKPLGNTRPMAEILKMLGAEPIPQKRDHRQPRFRPDETVKFLDETRLPDIAAQPTLVITPSIRTYDGRSEALQMLSEIPDPLTTVTYGAWVTVSKADAASLGVKDRQVVDLNLGWRTVELPARVMPGQPEGVLTVQRPFLKGMALPLDADTEDELSVLPLRSMRAGTRSELIPILSGSMSAQGRGIVPFLDDHQHEHHHDYPVDTTLYPPHEHKHYRWAMAIDLDRCTGCSACVAACYVENNIPLVGPEEHNAGREMSWLRMEPFANEAGEFEILPMMCQHCDYAPCEPVCPVLATYHNPEGLNAQVYNRCVGTRYCANNCPYKVRRFNWRVTPLAKPMQLMLNPDVSRRPAGVMEKCTFCVQRINKAKDRAKDEKRLVRDGELTTACAESCPAEAIVFGNILDPQSRVSQWAQSDRAYRVLENLGTAPAVHYLKPRRDNDAYAKSEKTATGGGATHGH